MQGWQDGEMMKRIKCLDVCRLKKIILAEKDSLRGQLVFYVWVGLATIFIPINIVNGINEVHATIKAKNKALADQASFAYYGVKKWRESIGDLIDIVSSAPPVRKLDSTESQLIFNRMTTMFPHRSWRLWSASGELIAGTKIKRPVSKTMAPKHRSYWKDSIHGFRGHGIYSSCLQGEACYVESAPVYTLGNNPYSTSSVDPVGILSLVIPVFSISKDSGLEQISDRAQTLSLQNKDYVGTEVLMVDKAGNVLFPVSAVNDAVSLQDPKEISLGEWGPIVKFAKQATRTASYSQIRVSGREFFAYSKKIDADWNLVAISDKESVYKEVLGQIREQIAYQLIALIAATLLIVLVCRKAAQPIQLAASVIRQFSIGNFEARVTSSRGGEVGKLLNDINKTGFMLRDLLTSQLKHAVTDQQVKTAADIQKSFIADVLPVREGIELAGDFDPAYEIGADWYDVLMLDDITYIVIADVCDKGIASALFMSVFRSLVRYSLIDEHSEMLEQGMEKSLEDTIAQVNNYMVANHGSSAMFATLFVGAYDSGTQQLSYICAGHESPIIVRAEGVLEHLKTTGPAIGIFEGAKYCVNSTVLKPGQILFAYTDGLVDARSPSDVSWGIEGVQGVLSIVDPRVLTARQLLNRMTEKVNKHRAEAEQFDDLTMLILKICCDP
jgi:serine phosphatase RsbU (regulator of sigma subunit)